MITHAVSMLLQYAPVGSKIYFTGERRPYRIRARSKRFLVCTKPFALQKTVLYCICDLELNIRGPENLVFGMGAESDKDCEEIIWRLEGRDSESGLDRTEVSHRNRVPLRVDRIQIDYTPAS